MTVKRPESNAGGMLALGLTCPEAKGLLRAVRAFRACSKARRSLVEVKMTILLTA